MLTIKNLSCDITQGFWLAKRNLISGITLSVHKGEVFALLGLNGAGKTTLLKCIMGLLPYKGTIRFNQKIIDNTALTTIGYAPDQTNYYAHLTGWQHITMLARYTHQKMNPSAMQFLEELCTLLDLSTLKNQLVKHYSQGMKKKLGIIISLMNDPSLLVRDEPMSELDPRSRKNVKELIKKLQQQGKTIIFSTHMLSAVQEIATNFCIIHQGRLIRQASTDIFTEKLGSAVKPLSCKEYFLQTIAAYKKNLSKDTVHIETY